MQTLKLGICFFDENDNIVSKRFLTTHWDLKDEEILRTKFDKCMKEEVVNILNDQIKIDLEKGVLKEMLEEVNDDVS